MTRAKKIKINNEVYWFDTNNGHKKATDNQLELLSIVEDVDLEDLLESSITQADVLKRLRESLGHVVIPHEVLLRRQKWREQRSTAPECRICQKKGDSTRHHFINKWILKELDQYESKWSNRRDNCIPVCIDCHRDLHERNGPAHSIAPYLKGSEMAFATKALTALSEERPRLLILIAKGDSSVYESRLIKDWFEGLFEVSAEASQASEDLDCESLALLAATA